MTYANMVYLKVDWERSRNDTNQALKRNMDKVANTIEGVVRNMKPTMICFCGIGALSLAQIQEVANRIKAAWQAVEQVCLKALFETGAPYMTVYNADRLKCTCHRILKKLYNCHAQPCTAQTFLCEGPDGVTVDIINVHAPSSTWGHCRYGVTDEQRRTLIMSLLQKGSMSEPARAIGCGRFLIGGHMKTDEWMLSSILTSCKRKLVLQTAELVCVPPTGEFGDLCFCGGITATTLQTTAENHDPKHIPYGICWESAAPQQGRDTEPEPEPELKKARKIQWQWQGMLQSILELHRYRSVLQS